MMTSDIPQTAPKSYPASFKGTRNFVPEVHQGSSGLEICRRYGKPTFAMDIRNGCGAKRFFASGYWHFVHFWYADRVKNYPNKPPSIHEILDSSKPSRIYFDVDYKLSNQDDDERDHGKDERARAFLGGFLDHIKESITDMFGIIDDPDILVLDATTPSKISYHIIVDIFVQDICTVKEIVHTIKATYSDDLDLANELVDMAVYNHNRGMRVAWSSKENKKEGVLYPLAYVQSGDDDNTDTGSTISIQRVTEYDPEMMFKSLIQCLVDKNQIMTHIFKDKMQ